MRTGKGREWNIGQGQAGKGLSKEFRFYSPSTGESSIPFQQDRDITSRCFRR